jgi:hypothetical protein
MIVPFEGFGFGDVGWKVGVKTAVKTKVFPAASIVVYT